MNPPYKITNNIVNLVSLISEELGRVEASGLSTPSPQLRKQNRIKTIHGTLAIEGNTLSLEQITSVLEGKKIIGSKKEIREVNNVIKLYEQLDLFKVYLVKDFLQAHKILMNSLITLAGNFCNTNVGVLKGSQVSRVAPQHRFVPGLIKNLFQWYKKEKNLHPLIKSCILHYKIEFIHPFEDGNGRMGRFWQSIVLAQYDTVFQFIPIESLIKEKQKQYYKVLEKCDKAGSSTLFIELILMLLLSSLKEFTQNIKGVTLDGIKRLHQGKFHFDKNIFSRKDYMLFFKNISSATASRDLKEGVEKKLLKKSGTGNQTKYQFFTNN